jgi:predicted O-linked N-acetylglucosamine transferase (SPINDLY family)
VIAYSTGPDDRSPMRARLCRAFDRFVDVRGRDPLAVADIIRNDAIDILVDLKGHTQDCHAHRARAAAGADPGSLPGLSRHARGGLVDYLIGDAIVTPREHFGDYAEAIAVLPDSYQVNDRNRPIGVTPPRGELGFAGARCRVRELQPDLQDQPQVFDAWMRSSRACRARCCGSSRTRTTIRRKANLRREAQARGVDPARLVFARHRPNPEYLALYRHADLFLDTWPYNAHTTASDALWAGCPVLTLRGETFAGRVAESL